MVIAVLDVLLTVLLPLVMGAAITYTNPSGAVFLRASAESHLVRGELHPLRVLPLLLPVVWQPVAGTYLLVERLFGVFVVGVIGMALGRIIRAVFTRLLRSES
ncbi:hypothetical protein [Streptomyces sp. NBC_00239]|uniref:hypothetical protein n=1 Tax=Streptomyces sp. NBC_00239 TaxID=2903640 RepID=UPI002E2AB065|nr:hypothetical protein [Streptomyces sp. NBC_00239]